MGVISVLVVLGYNQFFGVDVGKVDTVAISEVQIKEDKEVEKLPMELIAQRDLYVQPSGVDKFVYSESELVEMESKRDPFTIQKEVEKQASDLLAHFNKQKSQLESEETEEQPLEQEEPLIPETEKEVVKVGLTSVPQLEQIIARETKKYSIDPKWVHSIIENESNYDPSAINENKDAQGVVKTVDRGLMQINSDTAPWLARKIGLPYTEGMEFNIETNIAMGTFYLSYLKGIYSDMDFIFTAYNRGPSGANIYREKNGTYESDYSKLIKQAL